MFPAAPGFVLIPVYSDLELWFADVQRYASTRKDIIYFPLDWIKSVFFYGLLALSYVHLSSL
jgi:hypothetical protein